ncbi:uncharacterized protein GLRG_00200 [Colletotrichum graminicola M1.001]|uniref:Uncharacterized protein n=1 Tax=Colletotrichum graminicola (strain M1.001 / M2 / FGSC 10212) TaxID=645133 RepID=E3Q377_COLGM|nr:uncharacterized protein GLRG_00200 [Colletotrichum graminicola M1.001]EFQ25056.1 hypothetical protein GLRG_00200 [Colletotrichum graminicola M1.001]
MQYVDGLPVLPRTDTEIAAALAATLARQPPVCFRDHTRGRCIHCTLTASPCTFTKATPSTPCGRCRRLELICMVRRPGTARRIVTGDEVGDWIPVQRVVEEAVGEGGARALAEKAMRESEEEGTRAVFGDSFGAKDVRNWSLPRVFKGGEDGGALWRQFLTRKDEHEHKETRCLNGHSLPSAVVEIE